MLKIDIGSGRSKFKDYKTIDIDPKVKSDIIANILDMPFDDNEVDEIRAHHILEHIDPTKKVELMSELWRVLKVGGILDIEVPLFPHPASVQDPTHISFWCKESFWYFTKGNKFGEAFKRRTTKFVPLFNKVEEECRGLWAYRIKFKK